MAARRNPVSKIAREDADERLLVTAAQDDLTKFGRLYDIHFDRVYAFIARRVRDRDRAEDLTSETFHKALAGLKSFEYRGAPFGAWLIRIAANLVFDHVKRSAREPDHLDDLPEPGGKAEQEEIETRARLFQLVDSLPAEQKLVVYARFVEQRSIGEIARQLGKTEGAVKQLQFRALEKLRSKMEGARA